MSWGLGGSDSTCVLGVEWSEKKNAPPPKDNFWNSPKGKELVQKNQTLEGLLPGLGVTEPLNLLSKLLSCDTDG